MITPQSYYILVQLCDLPSDSPILRPDGSDKGLPYGLVLACGPDVKTISVNDKVMFQPGSMIPLEEKKQTVMITEGSVFAKLELED